MVQLYLISYIEIKPTRFTYKSYPVYILNLPILHTSPTLSTLLNTN